MLINPTASKFESKLPLALVCFWALTISGCYAKKPPSAHLAAIRLGSPNVPPAESFIDSPRDIPTDESHLPQLVISHTAPLRPRVASTPPSEPAHSEKPREPLMVPEVPTADMLAAKSDSEHSLAVAEKNLSLASGKSLNPVQQDLISKVRGFSDSARDAMKAGDWLRAKNLSKKAEVLSAQLAESF